MSTDDFPSGSSELCQIETGMQGGRVRRPGFLYVPMRLVQSLREHGFRYTLEKTVRTRFKDSRSPGGASAVPVDRMTEDVLNLLPGEVVQVKPLPEILATLDGTGRLRGLVFTPEMRQHCGKRHRVYKRLELMFDEYHRSQHRMRHTVLLENVVCEGAGLGCHRSCFLYWREAWLRRVQPDDITSAFPASLPSDQIR